MPLITILQQVDLSIFFFINQQLANPLFDIIFKSVHYLSYVLLFSLILYFTLKKKKSIVLLMVISAIISSGVAGLMKTGIERERPYQVLDARQLVDEDDNRSFPSNHVQLSFALSTIVFYFYRKFGTALFLLSLIMGFGRIYVGVHYPSDVLVGALIGILLAVLVLKMNMIYKKKLSSRN